MKKDITLPNKIALIGYGYWGKKIFDTVRKSFPKISIQVVDPKIKGNIDLDVSLTTFSSVLKDKSITHILVATPEETHFDIAKECLLNSKNIFIEKPTCLFSKQVKELEKIAQENNLSLFTDYIFLYDPYVKIIKKKLEENIIGELKYIESTRHSIKIHKPKLTVFDDLAIHDIYLGKYFFDTNIVWVKHVLSEKILHNKVNQATVVYSFGNKPLKAHYSWVKPRAERTMIFIGTNGTLVWDRLFDNILLYVNQEKIKEISIKQKQSPLHLAIFSFLSKKESKYTYFKDIEVLEKLKK